MTIGSILKKCLSCILVCALLISVVSPISAVTSTLAADAHPGYVALGDGATLGVGLKQANEDEGEPGEKAYYEVIAEALSKNGVIDDEFDYAAHANRNYRVEEIRYLVDLDYEGDGYTDSISSLDVLRRAGTVRENIKYADVITINVGVNNFSTYIIEQLMYYLDPQTLGQTKYAYSFEEFTDAEVIEQLESVKAIVSDKLYTAADDTGDDILDLINFVSEVSTYAILSYITSFNAMVEGIYELNPDVELYIIGIYNFAEGETLSYKGHSFEIGTYFGALVELANAYSQILAPRKYDYIYVDPGHPELLIDQMGDTSIDSMYERIPAGLVDELVELGGDAAINEVRDLFKENGIEMSTTEALGFLEDMIACEGDEDKLNAFFYEQMSRYVAVEVNERFAEELQEYLGKFGNITVEPGQVTTWLERLDAATDKDAEAKLIAEEMITDLLNDPELKRQAAANIIYERFQENSMLAEYVTVEKVDQLLLDLDTAYTNGASLNAVAETWVYGLAADVIEGYVEDLVGLNHTVDGEYLLSEMNKISNTQEQEQFVKDYLLEHAFHDYMVTEFNRVFYIEKGLEMPDGVTIESFITEVERLEATGGDYEGYIKNIVRGSVAKYADDYVKEKFSFSLGAKFFEDLFAGMDDQTSESAKKSYLRSKMPIYTDLVWDFYKNYYVYAVNVATAKLNEYLKGVENAADTLVEYNATCGPLANALVEEYEKYFINDDVDTILGAGMPKFDEIVDEAAKKIYAGYDEYVKAVDETKGYFDSYIGEFQQVYTLLLNIAEVDTIKLEDLRSVADKVYEGKRSYIDQMIDSLLTNYKLAEDEMTVAYIALRYYLAEGMMIMPSADGHQTIAAQVIKAIETGESVGSGAGDLANKVIDKGIDFYHLAKKYLSLPTTGSGQSGVLINPEHYVALGDNITNGTALPDGTKTYVDLLGEALAMEFNDVADLDKDIINNLAINGMRTEELLALVDPNYNGDAYTDAKFDIPSLREEYMNAISSAELITIEIGINNLVTYPMTQALLAYNGQETYEMDWERYFGSRTETLSKGKDTAINLILKAVENADSKLQDETGKSAYDECVTALNTVSTAVESLFYGILGYMVNLDAAVEAIAEANPDATIVLVGFYNPLDDTYVQIEKPIEIGDYYFDLSEHVVGTEKITGAIVNEANRFLTNFVGFYADDLTAANEQSRFVTVDIREAELCVSDASKNLANLGIWKTVNVKGHSIEIYAPEYLLDTLSTGGSALHPNADGHEYIYNQILDALKYEIHADVIPEDLGKIYGEADPDLTYVMDDMSSLYDLVVSLKREEGEDVGTYDIIATVVENGGYAEVDVVVGTFTITERPVSVHVVVLDGVINTVTVTDGSIAGRDAGKDLTTLLGLAIDGNTVTASDDTNYETTVTYEFRTSTVEDIDVWIKSYAHRGDTSSYYGDSVSTFYAYAMFENGDPVPADFNIVLGEVPVAGSAVGNYTISFTYTDVEGYNVVEASFCTWEITARPISLDVTVVDGIITDVIVTDGSIAACDAWSGTTADLITLLGLTVNAEGTAVTASNSNYDVTIDAEFKTTEVMQIGTVTLKYNSMNMDSEIHYNFKFVLEGFNMDQIVEIGVLKFNTRTDDPNASDISNHDEKYVWTDLMDGDRYVCRSPGIPAKNMGDDAWYKAYVLLKDGTYVYSQRTVYSGVRYTKNVFKQHPDDIKMQALCVSLMNYGAAAQVYFAEQGLYEYETLMNSFLDTPEYASYKALVEDFDYAMINERLPARHSPYGEFDVKSSNIVPGAYSVTFLGALQLNAKNFTYDFENVDETGFVFWDHETFAKGETLTWENAYDIVTCEPDGTIEASVEGITAARMCDTFVSVAYVKIGDQYYYSGVSRISIDYYARKVIDGDYVDSMKELAKYTVVYGEYAYNYFRTN